MVTPRLFGEERSAWRWWWRLGACAGFVVLVGGHEYRRNVENKNLRMEDWSDDWDDHKEEKNQKMKNNE